MFANQKNKRPAIEVSKLSSLIAEGVEITGDLCFASGVRMDGRVNGNVVAKAEEGQGGGMLVLSEKGHVEGTVHCGNAVINGTIVGDVQVEHFLELQSHARVSGTIRYKFLSMEAGAVVHGQLIQTDDAPASANVVAFEVEKAISA